MGRITDGEIIVTNPIMVDSEPVEGERVRAGEWSGASITHHDGVFMGKCDFDGDGTRDDGDLVRYEAQRLIRGDVEKTECFRSIYTSRIIEPQSTFGATTSREISPSEMRLASPPESLLIEPVLEESPLSQTEAASVNSSSIPSVGPSATPDEVRINPEVSRAPDTTEVESPEENADTNSASSSECIAIGAATLCAASVPEIQD